MRKGRTQPARPNKYLLRAEQEKLHKRKRPLLARIALLLAILEDLLVAPRAMPVRYST